MNSFKEGDPLENWQARFPLPESFNNPEFKLWIYYLDGESQKRLGTDIEKWYLESFDGLNSPIDEQVKRQIDQFLGASVNLKNTPHWFPGLSNQRAGTLRRIAAEEWKRRIKSKRN